MFKTRYRGAVSARFVVMTTLLMVAACGGGGRRSSPPPPPPLQAGVLQLSVGSLSVQEDAATASLTVTRSGGSDGVVSVRLASSNGTASAGADYAALDTTVSFAAGDAASKTVTLSITNDTDGEADETLSLALSAPTGGAALGATTTATLTIADDDPPPAPVLSADARAIKQLQFSWASVAGATSYRLLQDPDGASGFTRLDADLPASATNLDVDIAVHRLDWVNAMYRLDACNANGCTASNAISATNAMLSAIGYFKASSTDPGDWFGWSIALSADANTLAVGAPFEDSDAVGVHSDPADPADDNNSADAAGAVYVFTRAGNQWAQQAYVKASNTDGQDFFGVSLALSADGSTLAVGAMGEDSDAVGVHSDPADPADDDNSADAAGAVYVFTRAGNQWAQQAYVKASNTDSNTDGQDFFGVSLALSADGSMLAVGATGESSDAVGVHSDPADPADDDNSADAAGAVYVFTRAGNQWAQQAYVKASNTGAGDTFGVSLALSADGSMLAVGAIGEDSDAVGVHSDPADPADDDNSADTAGAVYVFTRAGNQWAQQAYVKASNTGASDRFGQSLALSADGSMLAVGANREDSDAVGVHSDPADPADDDNSANFAGAVYMFTRAGNQWAQQAYVKASNTGASHRFGESLALSADGSMLAVGATGESSDAVGVHSDPADPVDDDNGGAGAAGAVYVFTRAGNQWAQQAYVKASNTGAGDTFGVSLALSADGSMLAVGAVIEASAATGINGDQTDDSVNAAGALYLY